MSALTLALLVADPVAHTDSPARLVAAAVLGIAVIVALIVWRKMHPFLALALGSTVLAVVAGVPLGETFTAFTAGLGSTIGGVGTLIAFGAIIGRLLIDSGGADQIVDTILARTPGPRLPWAMGEIGIKRYDTCKLYPEPIGSTHQSEYNIRYRAAKLYRRYP